MIPVYRGVPRRLWTHHFGYGIKMWPCNINRLKKDIRARLTTEDYTCRLPKIKPRVRYKLKTCYVRWPWPPKWIKVWK